MHGGRWGSSSSTRPRPSTPGRPSCAAAVAREVAGEERAAGIALFSRRSLEDHGPEWTVTDVQAPRGSGSTGQARWSCAMLGRATAACPLTCRRATGSHPPKRSRGVSLPGRVRHGTHPPSSRPQAVVSHMRHIQRVAPGPRIRPTSTREMTSSGAALGGPQPRERVLEHLRPGRRYARGRPAAMRSGAGRPSGRRVLGGGRWRQPPRADPRAAPSRTVSDRGPGAAGRRTGRPGSGRGR